MRKGGSATAARERLGTTRLVGCVCSATTITCRRAPPWPRIALEVQESSSLTEDSSRTVRWLKRPDGGAEWENNFAVDTLYGTSSASSNRIDKVRVRMLRFESLNVRFD